MRVDALANAMSAYLGDVNINEPILVAAYDKMVPEIDSVRGVGRRRPKMERRKLLAGSRPQSVRD